MVGRLHSHSRAFRAVTVKLDSSVMGTRVRSDDARLVDGCACVSVGEMQLCPAVVGRVGRRHRVDKSCRTYVLANVVHVLHHIHMHAVWCIPHSRFGVCFTCGVCEAYTKP